MSVKFSDYTFEEEKRLNIFHTSNTVYAPKNKDILSLAIRTAADIIQKCRTRDPFYIIKARHMEIHRGNFNDLLGFFITMHKIPYIGINTEVDKSTQRIVAAHELGHALMHCNEQSRKHSFQDTMLYSLNADKMEQDANTFAGELLLDDDDILEPCGYYAYQDTMREMKRVTKTLKSNQERNAYIAEVWNDFYATHDDIATIEEIAAMNDVDVHIVEYKLLALRQKGFDLPNLPEVKSDFLRR